MNPMKEDLSEYGSRHVCSVLLTGGIGSGKSAVASYLESKGIPVYDSDSRTKALYDSDPDLVPSLERALGVSLRKEDGSFDRKALSSVIFSDKKALSKVESIVHPAVLVLTPSVTVIRFSSTDISLRTRTTEQRSAISMMQVSTAIL